MKASHAIRLGLRANWQQFALLVAINAFVGGVVGVERSTLAPLAENDFHLASSAAILSFLISFGLVKAASNFIAGGLADRLRNLLDPGRWSGISTNPAGRRDEPPARDEV